MEFSIISTSSFVKKDGTRSGCLTRNDSKNWLKSRSKKSFLLPEPEQHTQCGHDVYLIGGMGKDEGHDMIFSNILLVAAGTPSDSR